MNVGIDLVDCARCGGLISPKIFAPAELAYIAQKNNDLTTVAGLYAAKEAYFKATGTGIIKSQLPLVEVGHRENGQPYYVNCPRSCLSISHTTMTATAICIIF